VMRKIKSPAVHVLQMSQTNESSSLMV